MEKYDSNSEKEQKRLSKKSVFFESSKEHVVALPLLHEGSVFDFIRFLFACKSTLLEEAGLFNEPYNAYQQENSKSYKYQTKYQA